MSKSRIGVDGEGKFELLFCFIPVLIGDVRAGKTQIRFDALWIYLDRFVKFCKCLVLLVLIKENTTHQDVTLNVVGVFLKYYLGLLLGHPNDVGLTLGCPKVIVAEADVGIEIVWIEFDGSL